MKNLMNKLFFNAGNRGKLIEKLVEQGAAVIVFDMDFQRAKSAGDDAEFARAVADSERVVLFERLNGKRQPIYDTQGQQTGSIWIEELVPPILPLAEAAQALAPGSMVPRAFPARSTTPPPPASDPPTLATCAHTTPRAPFPAPPFAASRSRVTAE